MKKTLVILLLGLVCFGVSALIGTHVDANGVLVEKGFFLIPLGYLLLFVAGLHFIYQLLKSNRKK